MRRWAEPSRTDRLVQVGLVSLVTGVLVYAIHFVATIENRIRPSPPTSRPASVSAEAVWWGPEGYKEGAWVACSAGDGGVYTCVWWSRVGRQVGAQPYRLVEGTPALDEAVVVERLDGRSIVLRGGAYLEADS